MAASRVSKEASVPASPLRGRRLRRAFYRRHATELAKALIGKVLVHRVGDRAFAARIVETEAYVGEHDLACHAAAGRTARTEPLYGAPGIAYVYFIYGMYWCFNAVTRAENEPSAVLVRAIEPVEGMALMRRRRAKARRDVDLTNGPGKLCLALGIGREHNGARLDRPPILVRGGESVADADVVVTPRIGITQSADWPLRYFIKDNAFVSKTPASFPRTIFRASCS